MLAALYLGRRLIARCDSQCYNGRDVRCDCVICAGANHGAGLDRAVAQTRRMIAQWLDDVAEGGIMFDRLRFGLPITCEALFPLDLGETPNAPTGASVWQYPHR